MPQNPFTDAIDALADTGFPKPMFWLLLLGCAIAAILVWRSEPTQRSIQDAPLRAPRHRGHDVVAAVALEGTPALRLGTYPLDAGDG